MFPGYQPRANGFSIYTLVEGFCLKADKHSCLPAYNGGVAQKELAMKNIVKLFGVIALVAVIGFSMAACPSPTGGSRGGSSGGTTGGSSGGTTGGGSSGNTGSTIVSGADVTYAADAEAAKSITDFSYLYSRTKPIPLSQYINNPASVTIKDSKLDIKLGKPKSTSFVPVSNWFFGSGITITPSDAKCVMEDDGLSTSDGTYGLVCIKGNVYGTADIVWLISVDKDVTIKGKNTDGTYDVSLKKGWNYLLVTTTGTVTSPATIPDGYKWTVYLTSKRSW